jgi:hypothetical protein
VAIVTSTSPARIFPGIDKYDLEEQLLCQVFEQIYKLKLNQPSRRLMP